MTRRIKPRTAREVLETLFADLRDLEDQDAAGQIAILTWNAIDRCIKWRQWIKQGPRVIYGIEYSVEFMRERLRTDQIQLLKFRTWRATGIRPGSA
jgi:hypothetical protein